MGCRGKDSVFFNYIFCVYKSKHTKQKSQLQTNMHLAHRLGSHLLPAHEIFQEKTKRNPSSLSAFGEIFNLKITKQIRRQNHSFSVDFKKIKFVIIIISYEAQITS